MNEKNIKRYSLSHQVADQLEKMIEDGVYAVGEKIPTEPELVEMFSVSRNTLREAVKSLASAGILVVKQGDGTYVRSNNSFHARMSMEYENVSIEDIQEARNALELAMAPLACRRRTEEDLAQIREALMVRQQESRLGHPGASGDMRFHLAVAKACHNHILYELYSSISSFLEDHIAERQANTSMDLEQIDALHMRLFEAVRDADPHAAQICVQNILKI